MEAMLRGMYGGTEDIAERTKEYEELICVPVDNEYWVGSTIWVGKEVNIDSDVGVCSYVG